MTFRRIKRPRGSELVMQQIKEQIIAGELAPGARLASVEALGEMFGVGRSTVREALSALQATGWLHIRHGGGTYVETILPNETLPGLGGMLQQAETLKEVLEVRKVLETGCAALAALHRTEEDLTNLQTTLSKMAQNLSNETASEQADIKFHLQVAEATHNPLLVEMMESVSQHIEATMKESRKLWFYGERASAERLLDEHRLIFESIKLQDGPLASERMHQHLSKVEKILSAKHTQ